MSTDSVLCVPDPPDLLRRFIETPLQKKILFEGKRVLIRTNHPGCFDILSRHSVEISDGECELVWTLVCDGDLPVELGEPTVMESGPVAVLSFGRGCFMALQRERMELMGFISAAVEERSLEELILPRVKELIAALEPRKVSHE
jgi:hypothetical protein